jgi:triphosphoribosyl-dephospho-CoA synthase
MVVDVPDGSATLTTGVDKGQADSVRVVTTTVHSVASAAQLACVLEASAEKPGNITPSHDFDDTTYEDMLRCAIAIGPELVVDRSVGETVLAVVQGSPAKANTNLGIALLLAPLAKAALAGGPLRERLGEVLRDLGDARAAYAAIRLAGAGGLDEPVEHDVRAEPEIGLREAMAAAADRDSVASEYVTDFALTFEVGLPALRDLTREAIVELHLRLLAHTPDTLIARKAGAEAAARVSADAREVLAGRRTLQSFDASLRQDGNRLNPGTTADLVTATIFVALVEGMLAPSHHSS